MKNLKITLFILTLGSMYPIKATPNYIATNIVGPLYSPESNNVKIAALDVVGDHKYYLKYGNNKFNYKKIQEEQDAKNTELPLTCNAKKTVKETC